MIRIYFKVYFWLILVFALFQLGRDLLTIPLSNYIHDQGWATIVSYFIYVIMLVGLYGYCYKKKIGFASLWRIIFIICCIFRLVEDFYFDKILEDVYDILPAIIMWGYLVPAYVGLYLYAFKFFDESKYEERATLKL